MAPFCSFGVAHGGEKQAHQCPRLWFSSRGSLSFGLGWPMPKPATCGKVHIPTDFVVVQEASDVESSLRLDLLMLHDLRRCFVA